jgi:hypothetical protein
MTDSLPLQTSRSFADMLRRFGAWTARIGFGFMLAVAAVIAVLATTVVGLTLALAALFLKIGLSPRLQPARVRARNDGTLEARQTADGWVIETPRR